MSKNKIKLLIVTALCLNLLIGMVGAADAQVPGPTSTPAPTTPPQPTPQPVVTSADPNVVTFSQLRQNEIQLSGPFDSNSFSFSIPADWQLGDGAQLNLLMLVSFTTGFQAQSGTLAAAQGLSSPSVLGGASLNISLNQSTLAVIPIDQVGEISRSVSIPLQALATASNNGQMALTISLNTDFSCSVYEHLDVFIHTNSHFSLPHQEVRPPTNLALFPRPIYQQSFNPDSALIIVPDQPSAAELQSALTVAAGLGNLTQNGLALDLTTINKLTPDLIKSNHLIFVGKAGSIAQLSALPLPSPMVGGNFQVAADGKDDGLIQMIDSPWSSSHVVLVVSGNTDQATINAAQALSTGILQPNSVSNLAIVKKVQSTPVAVPHPTDQTLADLGYASTVFTGRGSRTVSYIFNVPAGSTLATDSYLELVFGHSSLLDYNRSGIVVSLNNQPIGSVRMDDTTASQSTNHVRFVIPASDVVPGNNRLDVNVNIIPINDCTPPSTQGLWTSIWPESVLHLPLTQASINPTAGYDLAQYPVPFKYNSVLSDTAFVLPHADLESWRSAAHLAASLGFTTNTKLAELKVFYADDVPASERSKYNLILVGHPSQLPILSELGKVMPAPFASGGDIPSDLNFQITYRISPKSSWGYVEMMTSPWNANNVIVAFLGNGVEGVTWAVTSVLNPSLSWQVVGNLAVINDRQIIATDTRLRSAADNASAVSASSPANLIQPYTPGNQNQGWILPVLILTILIIAGILFVVLSKGRPRGGQRPNSE